MFELGRVLYVSSRREIPDWTEELVAAKEHECTGCGHCIQGGSLYERHKVVVTPNSVRHPETIETERYHIAPPCADHYNGAHG